MDKNTDGYTTGGPSNEEDSNDLQLNSSDSTGPMNKLQHRYTVSNEVTIRNSGEATHRGSEEEGSAIVKITKSMLSEEDTVDSQTPYRM